MRNRWVSYNRFNVCIVYSNIPPIIIFDKQIIINIFSSIFKIENTTNIGLSFCQVVNNTHVSHLQVAITLGNQEWHGKEPS